MSYIGNSLPANFQSLPAVQRFNGTGSATAFTLAAQIANDQSILVSVDGVTQDSNAYAVSGTTLTFTAAPSSGTGNIFVNTISPVGSTVVPPDGSVTKVKTDFYISQATAPSSPSEGDMWFNTSASTVSGIETKAMAVYNGTIWRQMSEPIFTATGGTITTSGGYTIHTFTSSGTFTPAISGSVEYLVIAGGGGGGGANDHGGGGGAGGYLTATGFSVAATGLTVTIGAGGAAQPTNGALGNDGSNSVFSSITSIGGGGGGAHNVNGRVGGSGGGGGSGTTSGGAGTASQGNTGGNSLQRGGGGGGGAGAVGGNVLITTEGGNGGNGLASSITGSSVTYAGGGGGGGDTSGEGGDAGSGGGGAGGDASGIAANGTANLGGGGGGSSDTGGVPGGGAGGSGIVIVRYLT